MNRRFQKKNVREILQKQEENEPCLVSGRVQKKVGLLLCTKCFGTEVDQETMAEVLIPDTEVTVERMERRLKELAGKEKGVGAIYLRVC